MNAGFTELPKIQPVSPRNFRTLEDEEFKGSKGESWVIPAGFITDLASVPRVFWALLAPFGVYTAAAVLHDYLCRIAAGVIESRNAAGDAVHTAKGWLYGGLAGDVSHLPLYISRRDADGMLRRVMALEGEPLPLRWAMWGAVRLNSGLSGATWRERAQWLLVLVLAVPVVAVPGVVNLVFEVLIWLLCLPFRVQARDRRVMTLLLREGERQRQDGA